MGTWQQEPQLKGCPEQHEGDEGCGKPKGCPHVATACSAT